MICIGAKEGKKCFVFRELSLSLSLSIFSFLCVCVCSVLPVKEKEKENPIQWFTRVAIKSKSKVGPPMFLVVVVAPMLSQRIQSEWFDTIGRFSLPPSSPIFDFFFWWALFGYSRGNFPLKAVRYSNPSFFFLDSHRIYYGIFFKQKKKKRAKWLWNHLITEL